VNKSFDLLRTSRFIPIICAFMLLCGCLKNDAGRQIPSQRPQSEPTASGGRGSVGEKLAADKMNEQTESANQSLKSTSASAVSEVENNAAEEPVEKPRDLGNPLVDHPETLTKLHPVQPIWIDKKNKQVVFLGEICQTNAPLEMFACPRGTKEHESIVAVPVEAYVVHTALLAVGAKPGKPMQFAPKFSPATGSRIDIVVRWKNNKGEVQTVRAQDWIKEMRTGKALDQTWIFGGSGFWKEESTGKEYYMAEGGDFICVANFPSAMLDLPFESSESNSDLLYQAFTERIPPRGTPVTLILKPKQ
jgi:hypothetical protein